MAGIIDKLRIKSRFSGKQEKEERKHDEIMQNSLSQNFKLLLCHWMNDFDVIKDGN